MREIRLFLFFLVGSMLGGWSVLSYSETCANGTCTQPADVVVVPAYFKSRISGVSGATVQAAACKLPVATFWNSSGTCPAGTTGQYSCPQCVYGANNASSYNDVIDRSTNIYSCPEGQNWILSGSTCTRPDCRADQVITDGVCACPVGKSDTGTICVTSCPLGSHVLTPDTGQCAKDCIGNQYQDSAGACRCNKTSNAIYSLQKSQVGASGCDGGCSVENLASSPFVCNAVTGQCWAYGGRSGNVCTPATPPRLDVTVAALPPPAPVPEPVPPTPENPNPPAPDPKETPDNNKDPVACGNAGGTYYTSNGQGKCGTPTDDNSMEGVKAKVKEKITTNPDGSQRIETEKETITTNPKTGQTTTNKGTTTTTKDAAGNVTGTGTSEETSSRGTDQGEGGGQCAKEPDSPMCRKGVVGGTKGKFESRGEEIEAAKAELKALFTTVSNDAKTLFGDLTGGAGGLPCPPSITVLGSEFKLCAADYSTQLSIIGTAIYLVCALAAAMLIFA